MSSHYLVKYKSAQFLHNAEINNNFQWLNFIEPGVKLNEAYYRNNLLGMKLLPDIFRISKGGVLSFNRMVYSLHWHILRDTLSLFWSERCPTSFLQHCGRRIHRI